MPKLAISGPATVVFLGAGFSRIAGVPLAGELFRDEPVVDRVVRQRLVQTVRTGWLRWQSRVGGSPEEYLAELEEQGSFPWTEAVWYASLVIALKMGELRETSFRRQLQLTKQDLMRRSTPAHEDFWTAIFTRVPLLAVITTNYDILAERGMRHQPRPRVPRPGFHYGSGDAYLEGGGYPSFSHLRPIVASGKVPLLKLHGSVSWARRGDKLVQYHDCRPAIRGDALIVAPVRGKQPPKVLDPIWHRAKEAIALAERIVVVGYSLPNYDDQVTALLRSSREGCEFRVLDPSPGLDKKYKEVLRRPVIQHPGLPQAVQNLSFLNEKNEQLGPPRHKQLTLPLSKKDQETR